MGLELYMVGVMVEDMARAVEFYRRLGVDIPEGSETKPHVGIRMSGMTFFLTTHETNKRWDPAKTPASGGYRMILEYNEMVGYGYESHVAPYYTTFNAYFAMINDPDGNTILLSGGDA
jgi:catechol 2,3-dioxygenase-like lactoylglutathione lyase family enzyme